MTIGQSLNHARAVHFGVFVSVGRSRPERSGDRFRICAEGPQDVRLCEAGQTRGLGLGDPALPDDGVNAGNELDLDKMQIGINAAEVDEDVDASGPNSGLDTVMFLLFLLGGARRPEADLPNPLRSFDSLRHLKKLPPAPVFASQPHDFNISGLGGRTCLRSIQTASMTFCPFHRFDAPNRRPNAHTRRP